MFGQQNTSPFASPPGTSTPFGAPAPAPFGSPSPAPFGNTGAFGSAGGGFGAPAPAAGGFGTSTGGAFGAPAPSTGFGTSTSTFGATGGFGSSATTSTSPFGAPAPSQGLFGHAPAPAPQGLFGGGGFGTTPAPAPGGFGSGFGGASTTTTSAFGAPAPSAFGAPQSGSIFGGAPTPTPAFGAPAPAPSTGLFGSPAPAPLFGGAPAQAPSTGLFGAPATSPGGAGGTRVAPFQVSSKVDGSSTIAFYSVTAMPQYEARAFEELRFEDYSSGNRGDGTATQASGGFGGFGATAPGPAPTGFGGAFGAAPTSAFGSSPTPAPAFGAAPAPAFGAAPAPAFGAASGAFGAPAPSTGGFSFGAQPAPAPSAFGGFGAQQQSASTNLFGGSPTSAPAPSGGLFGNAPSPAPAGGLFGSAPAPAPTGLFGSALAPGGFGAPAPAPTTSGLFGAPAPAPPGGLFGAPAPTGGGLFGAAPAPSSAGGFGAPAPAGGLFGARPPGTSLFGSAPTPAPGGLFGAPAAPAPATGLFGAPAAQAPAAPAYQYGAPAPTIIPPTADAVLAQQLAALDNQRREIEQMEVWRGRSPQTSSVIPSSLPESEVLRVSPYSAASSVPYRASPKSTARIRPRGFLSPQPTTVSTQRAIMPMMSPDGFMATTSKRLVIKPKPAMRLRLQEVPVEESKEEVVLGLRAPSPATTATTRASPPVTSPPAMTTPAEETPPDSARMQNSTPTNGNGYDFYQKVMASAGATPAVKRNANTSLVPKLTDPEYTVSPSIEEMASMSEADLAAVSDFTVTRAGLGSVSWEGSVDVRGVDLDQLVSIEKGAVSVYYDEDNEGEKPPVGTKLNRPALITMYDIFPLQGSDAAAIEKNERRVAKSTKKMGAELISYDGKSGVWSFRVPHFSRYALMDDSDDEDEDMEVRKDQVKPAARNFESGERGGRSPQEVVQEEGTGTYTSPNRFSTLLTEDEDMSEAGDEDVAIVSDVEMGGSEQNVLRAAERAYTMMSRALTDKQSRADQARSILKKKQEEAAKMLFSDEGVLPDDSVPCKPAMPDEKELTLRSKPGLCARLAQKCGVQSFSASNTDYGMRMGRSFRVGWKPDGSFLHLQPDSAVVIQQSRPVFVHESKGEEQESRLLENHLKHSSRIACPQRECLAFSLTPEGLRKSLVDYMDASIPYGGQYTDPEQALVLMRAFSLLLCLFTDENSATNISVDLAVVEAIGENKAHAALREQDRIDSCVKWLTAACAEDVQTDVRVALEKNDVHSAIFAALAGGDIEQASSIATNHGYLHLASVLASGAAGFDSIRDQVQRWHESGAAKAIPAELIRVYTVLAGDLKAEEQIHFGCIQARMKAQLDWRRRLCMLLIYGVHSDDKASLESLLEKYESEVFDRVAPYPSPRYESSLAFGKEGDAQSLLYKILDLTRATRGGAADIHLSVSLADVVDPSGYTADISDFTGAFHTAAAISALGRGPMLSPVEQARLLDGYAAQLVSNGRWELAVYVMLCSFSAADRFEDLVLRERMAKTLVLQNYRALSDPDLVSKRSYLEKIGVPSSWFEEALAYHCAQNGNAYEYVKHLSNFSPEQARLALEELVVPNLLFMSTADIQTSMDLLEMFAMESDSLAGTILDFFHLSEDILALSQTENTMIQTDDIASLMKMAASIEDRLFSYRANTDGGTVGSKIIPSFRGVSRAAFLTEALAGLSFLQLQLKALEVGSSIWGEEQWRGTSAGRPLKVASELAFISAREASVARDGSGEANDVTLRGLI